MSINNAARSEWRSRLAGLALGLTCCAVPALAQSPAPPAGGLTGAAVLTEGLKLYDGARYADAVVSFGHAIDALNPADPQQRELLTKAYEYRARSRFVLKDMAGTESDFTLVLKLRPDYEPATEMSPRVRAEFVDVKRRTVGEMTVRLTPAGVVNIDGVSYTVGSEPLTMAFVAGEHTLFAMRQAYRAVEQKVMVVPGQTIPVTIALERISATFTVRTVPDGVAVLFDGIPKGITPKGQERSDVSGPLVIPDLAAGTYLTRYQRDCYKPSERSLPITLLGDFEISEPVRLDPAVAKLTLRISEPGATIYVDGLSKGANPADVTNICEGDHKIEVRSARARFIDQRYWKPGDVETLNAVLRPAFAILVNAPPAGTSATDFRKLVESRLAGASGALIFTPAEEELTSVQRQDELTADFFHGTSAAAVLRRRELGERVAARLGVQGVAAIESTGSPDSVQLFLLAAGSADPEVLTFDLNDQASRANAVAALSAEVPPLVRLSIDALLVDVATIQGAVVVRAAEGTGLAAGDVVIDAAGVPVTSVADLMAKLAGHQGQAVPLTVRAMTGATRPVPVTPTLGPDTIPLADKHLLYNGILLRLQDALREAKTPLDATAARLNLAIVEMRLGRWGEATGNLEQLRLPEGAGVSNGTVAYLLGLCYEALGRRADATRAFTTASRSTGSMLSARGPRTAPLAEEKLRTAGTLK